MAEGDLQEKTEKATPRKRSEARKKGQVGKSREIPSVAVLLAGLSTLYVFGAYMYSHIRSLMQDTFSMIATPNLNLSEFLAFGSIVIERFIFMVLPVMIAVFVTALLSNVLQVGLLLSWEAVTPKLSKLDPIKGMQKLFSKQTLMELFKSLAKLALVGVIAYLTVKGEMDRLPSLADTEVQAILLYILKIAFKIFIRVSMAMILLAILDYAFQKWQYEQQLKMTKQEVKEEFKRTEGDPLIKSRIKKIQFEMAKRRMMEEVPKADVVVTNPVHLAIALQYDSAGMSAPTVLAKGAGEVAERIKTLAGEHHIPIVENRELAQNLYRMVEIGNEVPSTLYQAVAEVLAYVYKLKNKVVSEQ
ncbi:MAG: flagellar biosynthesis protein FlhB [Deltaproteobacteria bacterium]|nr:flagellar biosynthesis protein FlhB [Deltaproteobacteria bacterium]MBW1795381.1 flagellar biosynthesis protein FlhB [Deltaproteobacteria bacterium]